MSSHTTPAETVHDIDLDYLIGLQHQTLLPNSESGVGLTSLPGKVSSRRRGNGLDFEDLRRYHPGDDVRHMDWNVTARTRKPHIRLYREDRERAVTVAVDLRPNMFTGSTRLRADSACELAAIALWQAARNGDRCGAVVFDHEGTHSSRPRIAHRGVLDALGLLIQRYREAKAVAGTQSESSLDEWLGALNAMGRISGSILLFSGLDRRGPDFQRQISVAGAHGRLACILVSDSMERKALPPGHYPFLHDAAAKVAHVDLRAAHTLQQALDQHYADKCQPLRDAHVGLIEPLLSSRPGQRMLMELNRRGYL